MTFGDVHMLYQYNHNQRGIGWEEVDLDNLPHIEPAGTWIATLMTLNPGALLGCWAHSEVFNSSHSCIK